MGDSEILLTIVGKVIGSVIIATIIGYIFYFIMPDRAGDITLLLYIIGFGNAWLGIDTLIDAKKQDSFLGNLHPFILTVLLTSLMILIYIVIISLLFPILFGTSFTLPAEYYGYSTKAIIGIFAILMIFTNSFIDYKFY